MAIITHDVDAVIGIDTHRDTHQVALVDPVGAVIAELQIANSDSGFCSLVEFLVEHSPGARLIAGVEGTRSYGVGVSRALTAVGIPVVEVEQPQRASRRGKGKSDRIDAQLAAAYVLRHALDQLATPRADGTREALRILLCARAEMTATGTAQTNRLRALLLAGNDEERRLSRRNLTLGVLTMLLSVTGHTSQHVEARVRQAEITRLAASLIALTRALRLNKRQLAELTEALAPGLQGHIGVGPVSAAQTVVAWSHPGRVRNDAAFAALAGTCPIPASSGRTVRHRLNRGGDRSLNNAIHTITVARWRCCPRTKTYIDRRRAEGKTDREIRRCLKRYITRELFRALPMT